MTTNMEKTVNATLAMGHQADLAHCYKFHILQRNSSTQYFTTLFGTGGGGTMNSQHLFLAIQ